jgi:uncharacterized damage-inducible protein DinB
MTDALAALARRFRFNEQLLAVETSGFEPEDWARRPGEQGGNTAHWILGHVTQSRRMIARRLGAELHQESWERLVGLKSKPEGRQDYPAVERLLADLRASGEFLERRCAELGESEARAEWGPRAFPDGSRTLEDGLHFLYFHETYHLGQIGLIRRICGKPGFA